MTITAAADGSALGNPGPAGWAWYVDEDRWAAGGWPHGTNNQGELMAVLDLFTATAGEPDEDLLILCDSQYVINTITKWMAGWKRKGWRKADGSPVLNLELIKQLDTALVGRRYRFEWVKGHAGHDLNEAADDRARAAAEAYQSGSSIPTGPGWPRRGTAAEAAAETAVETSVEAAAETEPAVEIEIALFDADYDAEQLSPESAVEVLERRLLDPAVRADASEVAALLHPQFEEIGSSGRQWDRETVLQLLEGSPDSTRTIEVISTEQVSVDAVLLVYRSLGDDGAQLRSSLWLRSNGHWRLRFHQGTPA